MVERGCNPDILDAHDRSPLFYSVLRNALPAVLLFLQYGVNLHFIDVFHKDVLEYSLKKRYVDIMRALLRSGIKLGKNQIRGKRLLFNSCKTGDFETAAILIERGLSLSIVDTQSGNTPLQTALQGGDQDFFIKLMKFANAEDVNLADKDGSTLLTRAILLGSIVLVKPLLEIEGVSINRRDKTGLTPLMIAARQGFYEIVELILTMKPLCQQIDNRGNTALFHAVMRDKVDTVKLLLKHGASIYHRNFSRKLPIDEAKSHQCRALLKHSVGRNSQSEVRDPPLSKSRSFISKDLPSLRNIPRRPRAASQNLTNSLSYTLKRRSTSKAEQGPSSTQRILERIHQQHKLAQKEETLQIRFEQKQAPMKESRNTKIMPVLAKLKFQQFGAIPLSKTYDTKHDQLIFKEEASLRSSRLNWEVVQEDQEQGKMRSITERGHGMHSSALKRKWIEVIEYRD